MSGNKTSVQPALAAKTAASPRGNGQPVNRTQPPAPPKPERFWLEIVTIQISKWLGSLQLAVILLIWFAAVLAIGTVVESWYNGRIAQELVYRTWWFFLLLGLLAINIFFAAA
jgi:hypothetical protein